MLHIKSHLTSSNHWYVRAQHWGTSTQTSDNPSQCIPQGTRSHTHLGWCSSHLCIQSTHTHRAVLCKLRGNYSPTSSVQNISRLPTCNQGWPTAKCHCRHDHCWIARWYQGCSKSIMAIPWTMWFTHCRGWTYPRWRSNHCSPRREEEGLGTDPSRILRYIQVPIQCVYWPGINKDIEQQVEACATCQRHWPQESRQPLKPTPPPEQPWQQLGADFMMFHRNEYLVIVDYYSKMPIV